MPDFTLNFRVGGERRSTADADPKFVAAKTVAALRAQAEKKSVERVALALEAAAPDIIAAITKDAETFGSRAARVFTKIQSPEGHGVVSTALEGISRSSAIFSRDRGSSRLQGKTTVEWAALTKATLNNKRRRQRAARRRRKGTSKSAGAPETFFVDTGALRQVLLDYMGPAFAALVDPKVVVKRGPKKVTVTLSILAQASGKEKAGVTSDSLPGIYRDANTDSESLFVRYLKRAGAPDRDGKHPLQRKLENPRGKHRPFFQNTLIFWISQRLPGVLDKSLRSAIAQRSKKAK